MKLWYEILQTWLVSYGASFIKFNIHPIYKINEYSLRLAVSYTFIVCSSMLGSIILLAKSHYSSPSPSTVFIDPNRSKQQQRPASDRPSSPIHQKASEEEGRRTKKRSGKNWSCPTKPREAKGIVEVTNRSSSSSSSWFDLPADTSSIDDSHYYYYCFWPSSGRKKNTTKKFLKDW